MLLALIMVGTYPGRTAVAQEDTWGPWEYAETMTQLDPFGAHAINGFGLAARDEVAVRFHIDAAQKIEVSVFLETRADFDTSGTTLKVRLRAETDGSGNVPGDIIANTDTAMLIAEDEWEKHAWYSAVIDHGEPLTAGTYWVCLYVEQSTNDWWLFLYIVEHADTFGHPVTWDANARRYLEMDGLQFISNTGEWLDNLDDPYIRVRQLTGTNYIPVAESLEVDPTTATVDVDPVTFTGTATDGDDVGEAKTIEHYRFRYKSSRDPKIVVLVSFESLAALTLVL